MATIIQKNNAMHYARHITNREEASLDKYLSEISREKLITAEEEVELAKKIKQGDQNALEKLTKSNLRFVVSVAKQYQNQGLTLPDLINEGNLGLIKAAQRFDETRGFKFITYAVWWIRQAMLQALAENSRIVRLPLNKIGAISKMSKAYDRLEQKFQRTPSAEEIAEVLEITEMEVKDFTQINNRHISMDAPLNTAIGGEDSSMYDVLKNQDSPSPEKELLNQSLKKEIERVFKYLEKTKLEKRDIEIVKLYFGLSDKADHSLTLDEIGEKYNLGRESIRQIREKVLRMMKHTSRNKHLRQYLG